VTADAEGFVTVVDRLKELIISGGFNISPSEVEQALPLHPDVADAAVVDPPRSAGGERWPPPSRCATAPSSTPRRSGNGRAVTSPPTRCRRRSPFDTLPRSLVGKVQRREVREELLRRRAR
jgi:long-chain acyl-CoA synthetase